MSTIVTSKTKSLSEIIQHECSLRQYKKINLEVFNHGVRFVANEIYLYCRAQAKKYIIVLQGTSGYLVNTEFELHHAESEYLFLCQQDEAKKKNDPILINFFTHILYDKNMIEVPDSNNSSFSSDASIIAPKRVNTIGDKIQDILR